MRRFMRHPINSMAPQNACHHAAAPQQADMGAALLGSQMAIDFLLHVIIEKADFLEHGLVLGTVAGKKLLVGPPSVAKQHVIHDGLLLASQLLERLQDGLAGFTARGDQPQCLLLGLIQLFDLLLDLIGVFLPEQTLQGVLGVGQPHQQVVTLRPLRHGCLRQRRDILLRAGFEQGCTWLLPCLS